METGRVIHGRYLLQRLIQQTAFCCAYQGTDQRLQRAVAVKSVLAPHSGAYRTAMKMTANFSHAHIIGLYDLVIEPETLYVVQEYVEGENFATLVQSQLSPYEIAQMGWQICQALMYAGSSSRRVCHGDLTPAALMRDHHGMARLNGFALPTNLAYFEKWSALGGEGVAVLETGLPPGQQSDARRADDTRATGLLLYQLLTGSQELPPNDLLRFSRNTPPELCETLARAIVRQHPHNINTPEVLYVQFKTLAEALEPAPPVSVTVATPSQVEEPLFSPVGVGKLSPSLPVREAGHSGRSLSSYSGKLPTLDVATSTPGEVRGPFEAPLRPSDSLPSSGVSKTSPALTILLLGLLAFGLFFIVGYVLGHLLIH